MTPAFQLFIKTLWVTLLLVSFSANVAAHESRPLYIEITQSTEVTTLFWTTPDSLPKEMSPTVELQGCALISNNNDHLPGSNFTVYSCDKLIQNLVLKIEFPTHNPSLSTMIKWTKNDTSHYIALPPGTSKWPLPQSTLFERTLSNYSQVGFFHILSGTDHLLFLLALIFITRTPKRTLGAVTGFTLAHSLTLGLSAYYTVSLNIVAVEALIALSIVFLASEIIRDNQNTFTWKHPMLVAAVFGLVHGLGFATILTEITLPQQSKILALLFFNIGIEIGQILFLITFITAIYVVKVTWKFFLPNSLPLFTQRRLLFPVGMISSLWFFERMFSAV